MPRIEMRVAENYANDEKKYNIKSAGRRGPDHESEDEVMHDLKENSLGKASLIEATLFSAEKQLNSENNFEIIDRSMNREGASQELDKKFKIFIERLGSKNIIHNNSAKDLIEGSAGLLFLSCARIKNITSELMENKKLSPEEKIKKEQKLKIAQEVLVNEFEILNNYLDLLTMKQFEAVGKEELGTKLGFLKNHLIRKKLNEIGHKITNKEDYAIIECGVENEIKMLRSKNKNKYIALIKQFSQK